MHKSHKLPSCNDTITIYLRTLSTIPAPSLEPLAQHGSCPTALALTSELESFD